MRTWLSPAIAAGLQIEVVIDEGNQAGCILEHASSPQADLMERSGERVPVKEPEPLAQEPVDELC